MTQVTNNRGQKGRRSTALISVFALAAVGCAENGASPAVIDDVKILAPLPGTQVSVAYFELWNRSDAQLTLHAISSPQFKRVEMHETTTKDNVSRMRKIGPVVIGPQQKVSFDAGGKHVMLFSPIAELTAGSTVTLEFQVNDQTYPKSEILQERLVDN